MPGDRRLPWRPLSLDAFSIPWHPSRSRSPAGPHPRAAAAITPRATFIPASQVALPMQSTQLLTSSAPAPGTKIPDFTLKLATREGMSDWKLSDHLGKGPLVFGFFPLAFTGVCTKEM